MITLQTTHQMHEAQEGVKNHEFIIDLRDACITEMSPLHVEDFPLCLEGYSQDRIILAQGPVYCLLFIRQDTDQGFLY